MNDSGKKPTVLVVDDAPTNIQVVRALLQDEYRTRVATNGLKALEIIDSDTPPDVVLLDLLMPEMDGYDVLLRLRSSGALSHPPVIVISSLDDLDSVVRCIALGAEDYLHKPFNGRLLKARISAVLEKKQLRDALARQVEIIRDILGKYVPERVAQAVLDGKGVLAPTHTSATILFADVAGFTAICEGSTPKQVVAMLNEYFTAAAECIQRHDGIVSQFQGDGILVTFNVPVPSPGHADQAVKVALALVEMTRNQRFGGVQLSNRIGICTGDVIAGNVGSRDRLSYTVHGDAVNVAARLEDLNKEFGTRVLIAGTTVAELVDDYRLRGLGEVTVRGRELPVSVYTPEAV